MNSHYPFVPNSPSPMQPPVCFLSLQLVLNLTCEHSTEGKLFLGTLRLAPKTFLIFFFPSAMPPTLALRHLEAPQLMAPRTSLKGSAHRSLPANSRILISGFHKRATLPLSLSPPGCTAVHARPKRGTWADLTPSCRQAPQPTLSLVPPTPMLTLLSPSPKPAVAAP